MSAVLRGGGAPAPQRVSWALNQAQSPGKPRGHLGVPAAHSVTSMVQHGMVWHSKARQGMARHGMAAHHSTAWHSMACQHSMAQHGMEWHGPAWHDTAWHGMAWHVTSISSISCFTPPQRRAPWALVWSLPVLWALESWAGQAEQCPAPGSCWSGGLHPTTTPSQCNLRPPHQGLQEQQELWETSQEQCQGAPKAWGGYGAPKEGTATGCTQSSNGYKVTAQP